MAGLFSGLELGKRALASHQLWLNTIGHNIANVNTPGFTRQRVTTTTTQPFDSPMGQVGTGVQAIHIQQVRDLFLTQQYRQENTSFGQWTAMEKTMTQIEALFAEPSDDSLSGLMNEFWNSWSALANDIVAGTESTGARNALKENTNLLTSELHRIYDQLNTLEDSVDNEVALIVANINEISEQIAELNVQISRYELGGASSNDLRDKRDYLIDQLSEYIDVNTTEKMNGATVVRLGSMTLIDETSSYALGTFKSGSGQSAVNAVAWAGTTDEMKILNGQLKGLLDTRDEIIPDYKRALDDMARGLVENVNALHRTGYALDGVTTGINFFDPAGTSASTISVSAQIENNINLIAASQSGARGDNVNALAILDLKDSLLMDQNRVTITDYYQSLIGKIGVNTSKAINLKGSQELLVNQIENSRQSVQGVSLDEEMTQMIKYQQAFDAAARVITTMDQALEKVINDMGVVGR
jgi:flagellar hook-associated protein 1